MGDSHYCKDNDNHQSDYADGIASEELPTAEEVPPGKLEPDPPEGCI
jgi:hypothetical protein